MTGRVLLRRLHPSDLRAFQAYRTDADLGRYQGWKVKSDDEARAFLEEMSVAPLLRPGAWTQVGISSAQDGALLGDVGLHLSEDGREAELGITLGREAQGRGLATEAMHAAIACVFETTRADRVVAITDARNLASIRLLERVGMTRVQTRDTAFRGEPCVEHVFALERAGIIEGMIEALGAIVNFFAFQPLRCGAVAAFFTAAYFIPGATASLRSVIGIAATSWWAFCALEGMTPPHANVRMDLIFLFPLFIAVAIAGVMAIARVLGDRRRPPPPGIEP